jgi:hypothetical protein
LLSGAEGMGKNSQHEAFYTVDYQSIKKLGVIKINKLAIFTGKTWTLFLQKLENFQRWLTVSNPGKR